MAGHFGIRRRTSRLKIVLVFICILLGAIAIYSATHANQWTPDTSNTSSTTNSADTSDTSSTTNRFPSTTNSNSKQESVTVSSQTLQSAGLRVYKSKAFNVYDGDTFHAFVEGVDESIRVIGVDTPEMDSADASEYNAAVRARDFSISLIDGKEIYLVCEYDDSGNKRDNYGRLLAYVWLHEPADSLEEAKNEFSSTLEGKLLSGGYAELMIIDSPVFEDELRELYSSKTNGSGTATGTSSQGTQGLASNQTSDISSSVGPNTEYYIKGNISSSGEKIYHMPGQQYYDATVIDTSKGERWFRSEEEAQAAGWRKAKV